MVYTKGLFSQKKTLKNKNKNLYRNFIDEIEIKV